MSESATRRPIWVVCLLIATAVVVVYWPALHCGFINYDDPAYVTNNPHVQSGVNWASLKWALTTTHAANWHPLTWVSHMVDFDLYGLRPWGHHLASVAIHAVNSVLLFLVLTRMTGAMVRSAFVAVIFALHPLRVESVVWISERKDVLSAFFAILTIWAYFKYHIARSRVWGLLALIFFALGLAAKPMLVTLPIVLLLLDFWPLRRELSARLLVEKIPFLILAAGCSVMTFLAQKPSMENFPAYARWENVPVAYARYLGKIFWPFHLSFFYSYRLWPLWEIAGATLLLLVISGFVVWRLRQEPYLAVGWFWFVVMLAPTIGIVQVGSQSMADRYTYLPGIGIALMAVWGVYEWAPRRMGIALGAMFIALCMVLTWRQTHVYENSETLWRATLREDPECLVALDNLSSYLIDQHRLGEAHAFSLQALAVRPSDFEAENNLASIDLLQGRTDDALADARVSLKIQPHNEYAYDILGRAYLKKGDVEHAIESYHQALDLDPSLAEAWCNLGFALLQQRRVAEAVDAYHKALELDPNYALAHNDLGNILLQQGHPDEALAHFVRAAQIEPGFGEAHYNIAEILLRKGQDAEALAEYRKAVESLPNLVAAKRRIAEILVRQGGGNGR
jgi:tetratricopeptide (TPR) repeat protein